MISAYEKDVSGRISLWAILCFTVVAVLASSFIPDIEYREEIFTILIYACAILGMIAVTKGSGERGALKSLKSKVDPVSVIYVCVIAIGLIYFGSFFANTVYYLLESAGYTASLGDISVQNVTELIINLFMVAIIPAFCEELLIRDGVFSSMRKSTDLKKSILLSSMFFALLHGSVVQSVHQFMIGAVCALLMTVGGSIWYAIVLHLFNNAIAVVMTYISSIGIIPVEEEVMTAVEYFAPENMVASVVIAVIGLAIASCGYLAFLRRREVKLGIEHNLPYTARGRERTKALCVEEEKIPSQLLEKGLFWVAVGISLLVVVLDLLRGFGL